MTWRPVLIIFDLFPNFDMPDMSSFQSWMAVLLARSSLSGKSKHRSCQRALLATFPQESVASGRVWREQKNFERALQFLSGKRVEDADRGCLQRRPGKSQLFESGFWGLPVAACYEKRASMSRLVSLWRILFEVPTTDWCGVERAWRFPFFWMCLLYFLTLWHARQQD